MIFLQTFSLLNLAVLFFFPQKFWNCWNRKFCWKKKVTETQILVSPYVQMRIAEMKINSDVQESYSGMSHEIFHVRPNQGWGEMNIKDIFLSTLILFFWARHWNCYLVLLEIRIKGNKQFYGRPLYFWIFWTATKSTRYFQTHTN